MCIGCRAILYSLLLRTAPSHLQLLYECVSCRQIVICVCDGENERRSARALLHVGDADGAKQRKKTKNLSFFLSLSLYRTLPTVKQPKRTDGVTRLSLALFLFFPSLSSSSSSLRHIPSKTLLKICLAYVSSRPVENKAADSLISS